MDLIRKFYYYFVSPIRTATLRLLYTTFISSDHCATSPRKFTKLFVQQENNGLHRAGVQVQNIVSHFKLAYLGVCTVNRLGFFLIFLAIFRPFFGLMVRTNLAKFTKIRTKLLKSSDLGADQGFVYIIRGPAGLGLAPMC